MTDAHELNYIDRIAQMVGDRCGLRFGDVDFTSLLRLYALLALTTGEQTSLENVHDAWAAWVADIDPAHRSLIPFGDLDGARRDLDGPYAEAIRDVAAELDAERAS